jgi:hypothetical protein
MQSDAGASAATFLTNVKALAAMIRGYGFKFIICPPPMSHTAQGTQYLTKRLAVIADYRATWTDWADGFADFADDATIGTGANFGENTFTSANVTVSPTNTIAITGHGYTTAQPVRMESAGTLPTGLAAATTYYAIRVDANTIKLATSAANASGGTAISLTGAGSGTSTIWDSTLWQDRLHMWSAGLALVAPYIVDAVVALDDVTPPSVPASFAHGTPLGTSVPFTWSVSTGSPVAYQIRRATNSGFTTGVADTTITGGSSTSGSVTGLSGSTLYYFKIRARDIAGNWSAYSTAISATTDVAAFSPSDLTGLRQWLKADALSLADNDPVSSWTDSSGNALHATNTGSARPTFKTSIVNSLPIVRFDGADDLLVLGDHSSLTEAEVFIVVKLDTEPPASGHCGLWYMTTNGNNEFYPFTDGSVYENFGSTVRYSVGNPTPALTSWRIYGIHSKSNDWQAYIDGATFGTNQTTHTVGFGATNWLGHNGTGSDLLDGDVAEFILYNRKLTGTERGNVVTYLQTKYGI